VVIKVYSFLPYAIIISLGIVFLIIGFMFCSIFIPIRLVITLLVTLFVTYGMLVLLFQHKLLVWLIPWTEQFDSLYFFVPIFGYSLIIGLALDYDIFLFYRIVEYRDQGYTDKAAVIKGTANSGFFLFFFKCLCFFHIIKVG
jgi:uncharacterized membrane protein YdfJ with MMPL/SSD domain